MYQTSTFTLGKKKYINLGNQFHYKKYKERDRNISKSFVSIFHRSIYHEASGYTFYKEEKHLLGNIFGSSHTSNQIYLLWNCFSKLCIPQRYVNNLEKYRKNSVCIGVKNFGNL